MARKKRKATPKYTVKTLTTAVVARPCVSPTKQCPGLLSFPVLLVARGAAGKRQLKALAEALSKLIARPGKAQPRKAKKRRKAGKRRRR